MLDEYLDRLDRADDEYNAEADRLLIDDLTADRKAMLELLSEIKAWTQGWATDNNVVYMPHWYSKLLGWITTG